MERLPAKIADTVKRLKRERGRYIRVSQKNGSYYAIEYFNMYDNLAGKPKVVTKYIGRVTKDGEFLEAKHHLHDVYKEGLANFDEDVKKTIEGIRKLHKNLHIVKGNDAVYLYEINEKRMPEYVGWIGENGAFHEPEELVGTKGVAIEHVENLLEQKKVLGEHDSKILRILSMNGRATIPFIAKKIGLSKVGTEYRVKKLEKRFGIRYLLELDIGKLGFMPFLIFIKFDEKRPNIEELKQLIKSQPKIQFAAITEGKYDIVMYLLDSDVNDAVSTVWHLRRNTSFGDYGATWVVSPMSDVYSFIPLRNDFFDLVVSKKEWKKDKETMIKPSDSLLHREFTTLKELNSNGTLEFSDIDRKYGLSNGATQYTYYKLKEKGIVKRVTIDMENLPVKYIATFLLELKKSHEYVEKSQPTLLEDITSDTQLSNKYALVGNIGTPDGAILFLPVIRNIDFESTADFLKTKMVGLEINTLILSDILVGTLCYRNFDNDYTVQHKNLVEVFKRMPYSKPETYE